MLLKDTFIRLKNLRLGRADFNLLKKVLNTSENLAKMKQQFDFVRQCTIYRVFPTTDQNLRLPIPFQSRYLNKASCQVKRYILNKSKQQLRSSIAQTYQKQRNLDHEISCTSSSQLTDIYLTHKYLAYNTSSKFHGERLRKKLQTLLKKIVDLTSQTLMFTGFLNHNPSRLFIILIF